MVTQIKTVIRRKAHTAMAKRGERLHVLRGFPVRFNGLHINNPIRLCGEHNLFLKRSLIPQNRPATVRTIPSFRR